jgi:hypothetical protein
MIFEMDPDIGCCEAAAAPEILLFQDHCKAADYNGDTGVWCLNFKPSQVGLSPRPMNPIFFLNEIGDRS